MATHTFPHSFKAEKGVQLRPGGALFYSSGDAAINRLETYPHIRPVGEVHLESAGNLFRLPVKTNLFKNILLKLRGKFFLPISGPLSAIYGSLVGTRSLVATLYSVSFQLIAKRCRAISQYLTDSPQAVAMLQASL